MGAVHVVSLASLVAARPLGVGLWLCSDRSRPHCSEADPKAWRCRPSGKRRGFEVSPGSLLTEEERMYSVQLSAAPAVEAFASPIQMSDEDETFV